MADISERDLNTLLLYAFRYTLGRKSYAPSEFQDIVRKHADSLEPHISYLICREIEDAIRRNDAGYNDQVKDWRDLVSHLRTMGPAEFDQTVLDIQIEKDKVERVMDKYKGSVA